MEPIGITPTSLEKRSIAALCDTVLVSIGWCCLVLPALSDSPVRSSLDWPGSTAVLIAIGLLLVFALEMLTGMTLGKWLVGLRVRRPDGSAVPRPILALRGALKFIPTAFCFTPVFVHDSDAREVLSAIGWISLLILVTATYLGLIRIGQSACDLIAGTTVVAIDAT